MKEPFTIWLTGLSGSGKTTLARKIYSYYKEKGVPIQLLDGDVLRSEIGGMFGYTRKEREKAATIYRLLANILNQNNVNVVVASISPYKNIRELNRKKINSYSEIYIRCSLEECIRRDVKGLYKKALNGLEDNVVGLDEPFEIPLKYDLSVNTEYETVGISFKKIINFLENNNIKS